MREQWHRVTSAFPAVLRSIESAALPRLYQIFPLRSYRSSTLTVLVIWARAPLSIRPSRSRYGCRVVRSWVFHTGFSVSHCFLIFIALVQICVQYPTTNYLHVEYGTRSSIIYTWNFLRCLVSILVSSLITARNALSWVIFLDFNLDRYITDVADWLGANITDTC